MGPRLLLTGNVAALLITIAAFLQQLSWPVAGLLILTSLTVSVLLYTNSQKNQASHPSEPLNPKPVLEKLLQRPAPRAQPRPAEAKPQLKPSRPDKPTLRALPPAPRPPPTAKSLPAVAKAQLPSQTKSREKPGETPAVIKEGDYLSLDLELDGGKEVVGEVSASGPVNAYILTEENLASLDLGQEFWHETGSEGVQKATLRFTAPEKGKWFLVVENVDNRDVSASVKIHVNPALA